MANNEVYREICHFKYCEIRCQCSFTMDEVNVLIEKLEFVNGVTDLASQAPSMSINNCKSDNVHGLEHIEQAQPTSDLSHSS